MDLQQLRYMTALSQELNFVRAAKKSHVTQPTLSQQIKKLEDELGARLFERSSKQVRLTAAGEKFLPAAVAVLSALEKGIQDLRDDSAEILGEIRVSAIPTLGPYVLPEIITQLRRKAPKLKLQIYEETTSVLIDSLKSGKTDLGILALPVDGEGIASKVTVREAFYLAVSKKHALAGRADVSAKDLRGEDLLILQEGHCFGAQALEFCKRQRTDERVVFQGSSLTSVLQLAAAGEGITLVPDLVRTSAVPAGLKFLPFKKPTPSRELGLVWRMTAPLTRAHRCVMETAEEVLLSKIPR